MSTRTLFILTGALLSIAGVVGLIVDFSVVDVVFIAVGGVFLALAGQQDNNRPKRKR